MRNSFLPLFAFLLLVSGASGQTERCATDALHQGLLQDSVFARSYFAFEAALEEMAAGAALRSSAEHVLPVVVHVMHDGADLGTGSNISDAQVISAIDALNADFRGDFGGADTGVQFALAARDPEGNPTSGIVRVNVSSTIPSYSTTGMLTGASSGGATELAVKSLSHWPGDDYINVWVVHKLNSGASPIGFAYLPPMSGTLDGVVVHRQVFGIGSEYDLFNNFDLNRTLTHEIGHYLGLLHTFQSTSSCGLETNCQAQGDKVCDTPPTTGTLGCTALDCPNTLTENFMDYGNDDCMDSFTEGQRTRLRDALENYRGALIASDALVPVMATDVGLAAIEGVSNTGCDATLLPEVLLQNFGTDPITAATVYFMLDGGVTNQLSWNGALASGDFTTVPLPGLAAGSGEHTLTVWTSIPDDGYGPNDTLSTAFTVTTGSMLQMEIQFDALPYGISWSLENVDNGAVIMSGDNYANSTYTGAYITASECAVTGCYTLLVEDAFGNGMHYQPPGWYSLTDADGNVLGAGSGNFGSAQSHSFCIDGTAVDPCTDANGNGVCDADEDVLTSETSGCTDPESCTYDAEANTDDGSCEYLDALGACGGDCLGDDDGDGICNTAEIAGCTDNTACNYDASATDDNGACAYPPVNYDCQGNVTVVVPGCTDPESCTYDAEANTDDGSCEYLDALGACGGDCLGDDDGDGICNTAEIAGCTDNTACNYDASATDDNGACTYPAEGLDCDGNPLVVVPGCTDPESCTYDAEANTDDGSCEYLDALGACGGDCLGDDDGDGICNTAEIAGCTDNTACNYDASATDDNGACTYPAEGLDCDGNPLVVVPGCTDPESCTYDAEANTDDGSCEYLDALGACGGDCLGDDDGDGICNDAEIAGCTDNTACNYDASATDDNGACTYPAEGLDCDGNPLVVVPGCTDPESCTYDAEANTDDGSCEYLDALGECGGDCLGDDDGDGICNDAEIAGCTDNTACNYDPAATDDNGACAYPAEGLDCDGNPLVVVPGCTDPESCTYDAEANTDDGSCEYLDALGACGGDCLGDDDGDGICNDAEIAGCTDNTACNYDPAATDDNGACTYAEVGFDCEGNPLTSGIASLVKLASVTVSPNPAVLGSSLQIRGLPGEGPWLIEWRDLSGRKVDVQQCQAQSYSDGWRAQCTAPQRGGMLILHIQDASAPDKTAAGIPVLWH